jgi:hypothetical protein
MWKSGKDAQATGRGTPFLRMGIVALLLYKGGKKM